MDISSWARKAFKALYGATAIRAAALVCLVLWCAACGGSEQPQTAPTEVIYRVLGTERVTLTSELPGRVAALVAAEVRPQVDGIIQKRLFEEGADVAQGQVLYQIDPAVYQAAFNTAKAALDEAEATVVALRELETRYRRLVKSKSISQQELDNAIADHGQARARIARAKAELEAAGINLAYTRIKAPVSGRIGRSSVTPGALVTANQPEALAVIRQTGQVYVDITRSSADMLRLRRSIAQNRVARNAASAGVRLILEDGGPYTLAAAQRSGEPEWIMGELLFSEISVGQGTGSVSLRAVFPNPEGLLLPGMYAKAIIEEGVVENAVLVPQGVVMPDGNGGHYALVLESHGEAGAGDLFRVVRREVVLERPVGNRWLVGSGLQPGERLLLDGLQKTWPGDIVRGLEEARAPAPAPSVEVGAR